MTQVWIVHSVAVAGDALFFGGHANCDYDQGNVAIYKDLPWAQTNDVPDTILGGLDGSAFVRDLAPFNSVIGMDAQLRVTF